MKSDRRSPGTPVDKQAPGQTLGVDVAASPPTGMVFDIERYATHDGPGTRTTVFLKGCFLRCEWCQNPESEEGRPQIMYDVEQCIGCLQCYRVCDHGALSLIDWDGRRLATDDGAHVDLHSARRIYEEQRCGRCGACVEACYAGALQMVGERMSVEQVLDQVGADLPFYTGSGGGVTISGGEPLFQHRFTAAILQACRVRGIHTALDTTAFGRWESLAQVLEFTDLVLLDLKAMDTVVHQRYTGVDNGSILANAQRMAELMAGRDALGQDERHGIWIRLPLIPGVNDGDDQFEMVARFIIEQLAGAVHVVELLGYHTLGGAKRQKLGRLPTLEDLSPLSVERLQQQGELMRLRLRGTGIDVRCR